MIGPARPRSARTLWLALAKLAVSGGLLALLLSNVDIEGVGATLVRIPGPTILFAMALIALQTCVQGLRWWLVMRVVSGEMKPAWVIRLTFVGVFFNQVLPTSVGGDAVRIWHVHRAGVRIRSAIKSVLLERIWGVLALSLMVSAGLLYLGGRVDNAPLRLVLMAALPAGLVGVGIMVSFDQLPLALRRWRGLGALSRLGGDARQLFLSPALAPALFLMSVLGHVLSSLVIYVLAAGLGIGLSVWDCLAIVPSVLLATLIPVSFAGWGLREGAMIVLLGYLGTAADKAFSVSLIYGIAMIIAALPGCLFWLQWRETPRAQPEPVAARLSDEPDGS